MVTRAMGKAAAIGISAALLACTPSLDDHTSIVSSPRLLAVTATPAEGAVGAAFVLNALYVDGEGPRDPSSIDWAMCLRQKPLGEPGPIDPGCFVDAAPDLVPLGTGASVRGTVPADACELFGPDSPPPEPGQPSARPTDPDTTGGFYLPIRVRSEGEQWSAALERIACQPSGLTQSVFVAFTNGYRLNTNPTISELSRLNEDGGGASRVPPDGPSQGAGLTVSSGARLTFRAQWPSCAGRDACGGAESYIAIDPTSKQIVTRRESMVASWYATQGVFDEDRDGRDENDSATSVDNGWTAPAGAGPVHLWVVLRDARGGVGWGSYTITVRP
jgi:hypothetical protein